MKIFILSTLFFSSTVNAQSVSFKEIRLKPNSKFYTAENATIAYPIVVTKNKEIDKLINDKIKNKMLDNDVDLEKISMKKALRERINNGLINMSYVVTFKKHNILSLNIFTEGCGAYCSSGNTYFNFDLKTGKTLHITDLISENHLDSLRVVILNDKQKFLNQYKSEFKQNTIKEESDSVAFSWAMEEVDRNCIKNIQVENFSLSESYLQIIDPCEFPHAIRALEPTIELKYTYKSLSLFLKPRFQILFSN